MIMGNNDFGQYLVIILKTYVRFTLKELSCEFLSSFNIISGSEGGGILFLQIAAVFSVKKNKDEGKIKYQNVFTKKKKKKTFNNLIINKTSREGVFL